jgi:hypothetical protein
MALARQTRYRFRAVGSLTLLVFVTVFVTDYILATIIPEQPRGLFFIKIFPDWVDALILAAMGSIIFGSIALVFTWWSTEDKESRLQEMLNSK